MKWLDRMLQAWRYAAARPYVPAACELLDIGGFDGSFLDRFSDRIRKGVCVDPLAPSDGTSSHRVFIRAKVTDALPFPDGSFDVVVMFAVFEHLGVHRAAVASEAARVCRSGGRAILSVPSRSVDSLIKLLFSLRLIDGMTNDAKLIEEHDRFDPAETIPLFEASGFRLVRRKRFQLGLNNLFVFEKGGTR